MKTILPIIFLLIGSTALLSQDLDEGLIYYFPFSDSIIEQQSGTPLEITGPQNLTENRFGDPNCAWNLSLDTNQIFFEVDHPEFPTMNSSFTVSLWVQLDAVDSSNFGLLKELVNLGDIGLALYDFSTPMLFGNSSPNLWDTDWNDSIEVYNVTNVWYHLAFSFDEGEVKLYRDGDLKNQDTLENIVQLTTEEVLIGKFFHGILDDIRFYNRKLTEDEIEQLYLLNESCSPAACEFYDLEYGNFECLGDSIYIVTIDFEYINSSDSFDLSLRDGLFGTYSYGELPMRIQLPFDSLPEQFIGIADSEDGDCSLAFEFAPDCDPSGNCELYDLEYGNFECLGDSIYIVTIDFEYINSSDSFELSLRDGHFGTYSYGELPLRIQLPFDSLPEQFIGIADSEDSDCSLAFEFVPDCDPSGNCELYDLEYGNFECLGDSIYIVTIDFEYINTSDSFNLSLRDGHFGTYSYGELPMRIQLPFDSLPEQFIGITDSEDGDCSLEFEFVPDCDPSGNCELYDLEYGNFECLGDSIYIVTIDFEYINSSDSFDLSLRDGLFGTYSYTDLPLRIQLPFDNLLEQGIVIADSEDADCSLAFEFVPDCDPSSTVNPALEDISVWPNPFGQQIFIDFPGNGPLNYRLYSIQGSLIQQGQIGKGEPINTHWIPDGIYLLRIEKNGHYYEKLLIRRLAH